MANSEEVFHSHKEESRINWGFTAEKERKPTIEQIKLGAILRIADATEAMALNYFQLQKDLDYYKRKSKERGDEIDYQRKSIAALKGHLTKLRKKIADLNFLLNPKT
jgi:hypothetical protein